MFQLNVGGGPEAPGDSGRSFHGCLENLLHNGHSLIDLVKQKSHQVAVAVSQSLLRRTRNAAR